WGLLGRPEVALRAPARGAAPGPPRAIARRWAAPLGVALLAAPFVLPTFYVWLLVEVLAFSLFASSLYLLMGPGGMVSFGHAAYFGVGAYGAALLMKLAGAPMPLAFLAAPLLAGAARPVFS